MAYNGELYNNRNLADAAGDIFMTSSTSTVQDPSEYLLVLVYYPEDFFPNFYFILNFYNFLNKI